MIDQEVSPKRTEDPTVLHVNISAEVNCHFDASSLSHGDEPRIVILMGGPAVGKTTIRRARFSSGFVLVDAAEIFIRLSQDEYYDFPDVLELPMDAVGGLVADRAILERRHIVTELIGADFEATNALIESMRAIGYRIEVNAITCDLDEAMRRNLARGADNVSCYYAEPYQRRWLLDAARKQHLKE